MSALSDYLENKVLDQLFGGTQAPIPATLHFALFTTAPSDSGGGVEVSGNGYTRASLSNTTSNWPLATSGSKSNAAQITFPSAAGNWGAVVGIGIFDAPSGGNLLFWTTIPSRSVVSGDVPRFAAGGVTITLN
jgi:hypothetical protein